MLLRERDMDDEYMQNNYDSHMSLLNCGGLTLVNKIYFPWARLVMDTIRSVYNLDVIIQDCKGASHVG